MHASKQAPLHRSAWQCASGPHAMRRWHTSPLQSWSAWQAAGSGATTGGVRSSETANVGIRLPMLPPPGLLPPALPPGLLGAAGLPCPPAPLLPPPLL